MDLLFPKEELRNRMQRFIKLMNKENPGWQYALIVSKTNMYYFTGTRQEGMLLISSDQEPVLWVRRSYERAREESHFDHIMPMSSFKDAAAFHQIKSFDTLFVETEILPLAYLERFRKYFPFDKVKSLDLQVSKVRAVKSEYELAQMRQSGAIHRFVLEDSVVKVFREGMSEVELIGELYRILLQHGHHGVTRFSMFDTELGVGQVGFGVASLHPTSFDGPGGNYGISPASPFMGSPKNLLKKGDLIFLDVACGYNGYHTDKTMTYMFGRSLDSKTIDIHKRCVEIQYHIAELLKPGNVLSEIYEKIFANLDEEFLQNFMGFGSRSVKFLGHGIGLTIDEWPVIARGFDEPLMENMTFAVEPKKGIPGVGMVGIENTFVVTPSGGVCITGNHPGLMLVE
ncbi:MAG: Xaa-Pro peptidase family protein [Bacteroidales bacterium]|nr:Xaa-Pro peptidase family protein [Bacteroidales bacterium]